MAEEMEIKGMVQIHRRLLLSIDDALTKYRGERVAVSG
jgi:hypothetical protein